MNDLDVDRLLLEAGASWRTHEPPAERFDASVLGRSPARRRVPLTATVAAVAAVVVVGLWVGIAVFRRAPTSLGPGASAHLITPTPSTAQRVAGCDVTVPDPQFSAPPPGPAEPNAPGLAFYGNRELWTLLHTDGEVGGPPGQKTFWDSVNWPGIPGEPEPAITVSGTRLDGPGSFAAGAATNAGSSEFGDMMLVGVDVPSAGCWKITGRYKGAELSYVVWITTPLQLPAGTFVTDQPFGGPDCIAITVSKAGATALRLQVWSTSSLTNCVGATSTIVSVPASMTDGRTIVARIPLLTPEPWTLRLRVLAVDGGLVAEGRALDGKLHQVHLSPGSVP